MLIAAHEYLKLPTKSFQWNSSLDFWFGLVWFFFFSNQHYASALVGFCPVVFFAVPDLFVIPATGTDKTPMLCWRLLMVPSTTFALAQTTQRENLARKTQPATGPPDSSFPAWERLHMPWRKGAGFGARCEGGLGQREADFERPHGKYNLVNEDLNVSSKIFFS